MARGTRFSPERIIAKLRQIEGPLAQGKSLALACKEGGLSEQNSGTSNCSWRSSTVSGRRRS